MLIEKNNNNNDLEAGNRRGAKPQVPFHIQLRKILAEKDRQIRDLTEIIDKL